MMLAPKIWFVPTALGAMHALTLISRLKPAASISSSAKGGFEDGC